MHKNLSVPNNFPKNKKIALFSNFYHCKRLREVVPASSLFTLENKAFPCLFCLLTLCNLLKLNNDCNNAPANQVGILHKKSYSAFNFEEVLNIVQWSFPSALLLAFAITSLLNSIHGKALQISNIHA